MTGIVGRRQGSRRQEMAQVDVGDFWFVGVLFFFCLWVSFFFKRLPQRFHQQMTRRKSRNVFRRELVSTLWWVSFKCKDCLEPCQF
jgi:hypothetical protein